MSQPLGITKNLEHSFDGIRVQIRSADAPACFEEYFTGIKRTGPTYFQATN